MARETNPLEELLTDSLKDLYSAEHQLIKALPKMARAASSPKLKRAFESHLKETRQQVKRLEQVFSGLDASPKGKKCKAMEALLEEGKELMNAESETEVLDAALIAAAQKVEHYEIAGYGSVRTFANLLNEDEAARLLQATLDEESETNEILNGLAESIVNPEAVSETKLAQASSNR